jgi:hypothetical protein
MSSGLMAWKGDAAFGGLRRKLLQLPLISRYPYHIGRLPFAVAVVVSKSVISVLSVVEKPLSLPLFTVGTILEANTVDFLRN